MEGHLLSKKDLSAGEALLKAGKVGDLLFSEGTYQVETADLKKKGRFWPFLQLDDEGRILDCFCSCPEGEKKKTCPHIAAAYLKIFHDQKAPLHVNFRGSLWNILCQVASRRHGYEADVLKKKDQVYEAKSSTGKLLFSIKGTNPKGKKRLQEILFKRAVETEETSLKFSNLPQEEIALWREGRPSHQLQYELSFWSDLAKWMMTLQEDEEKYTLEFEEAEKALPHWIHVRFPLLFASFYIAEVNWPQLIPALSTVDSPLPVYEFQEYRIKAIHYDVKQRLFRIEKTPIDASRPTGFDESKGIEVGEWLYVPNKGFFPKRIDPIFKQEEIPTERIASVLHNHPLILQKYLSDVRIHLEPIKAQYEIRFDEKQNLHIAAYVFEIGDLQKHFAAYFGPWVYVHGKGFYLLENLLFEGVEKVVPRDQMNDFINRHRVWLGGFEGFQTHVYTIESQLNFTVSKEGYLRFDASIDLMEESEGVVDFGEWIYIKEKGFFAKRLGRAAGSLIRPGTIVHKSEITSFLRAHRDELETLKGFFSSKCPLEKSGLEIFINEAGRIVVRPHFQFYPPYAASQVQILGEYTYVEAEGFCEIPYEKRVPEEYVREKVVPAVDENYFVLYEFDTLKDCIFSIQKELKKPKDLFLRVRALQKSGRTKAAEWLLEAAIETEVGSVDLFPIWEAVQAGKRYLFTSAGLLLLKTPRFNWLKNIPKRRWLKEGKHLRLSTMEWLRLTVFEDLRPPLGSTAKENETRQLIQKLTSFKTDEQIDLSGFKSDLRAYQEVGVRWLWFMYLHGLSSLLCDEMGLGKTHQAMGLIAAAKNKTDPAAKILVVCPTSVIYHWEELLKNFLPNIRVLIYYGISRKLESFQEKADILVTSYGTLRSEKQALSDLEFEIAVFDELQIAKNPQSQTHKVLKKIKANMRIGLTGTPIENRLLELKALFDVIVPGYLPQEAYFKELFVNPIEKNQDAEKKSLLSKLIKPFILRRKKSEVLLELPEKIEEIAYCDLSDEQRELYRKTFLMQKEPLMRDLENQGKPVPFLHVFALLSALKQICDHPCLITKQYSEFQKHKSGKWDLFIELLEETRDSGQKLVVFSQYLDMLDMMEVYLKDHHIGYASIRGSTRNRKEQLDNFRQDPKCEIFLASLQAVGVGVDLVSASVVIHYDRWWNPARENQATDRVHRIGQNRGVQVFKLVTKGTIEEHIHRLIEKKLTLMEGVIGFDEQDQIKGLDRNELIKLLWLINKDLEDQSFSSSY